MEPTLEMIDDFKGKASKNKRKTVREVVVLCLAIGVGLVVAAALFNTVPGYVGKTPVEKANLNFPQYQ